MLRVENADNCDKWTIPMDDSQFSVKLRRRIKKKSFKMQELKREKTEKMHMHVYLGITDVIVSCELFQQSNIRAAQAVKKV